MVLSTNMSTSTMVSVLGALDHLETAIDAVHTVDLCALDVHDLAAGVLRLQRLADRLRVTQAQWLAEADRAAAWRTTGARDITDWLATETRTTRTDATRQIQLADTLERCPQLADAVETGAVSVATAVALHGVVALPPDGADLSVLVDAVRDATPGEARKAADTFRALYTPAIDADAELERQHRLRSVRSSAPIDGMVTTTVVLPTLESRQFTNALRHAAGAPFDGDERTPNNDSPTAPSTSRTSTTPVPSPADANAPPC
jgi:hypothetical protein